MKQNMKSLQNFEHAVKWQNDHACNQAATLQIDAIRWRCTRCGTLFSIPVYSLMQLESTTTLCNDCKHLPTDTTADLHNLHAFVIRMLNNHTNKIIYV